MVKLEDLKLVKGLEKLSEDFPCENASYNHETGEMTCPFIPTKPEKCEPCIRMCGHMIMFFMRRLMDWLMNQRIA